MDSDGKGTARFSPGDFTHNARVAAAVVPAMAVMVGFGGTTVAGVCMVGAVAAYLLDALRQREGALAAVWVTLAASNLFLITSSSIDHGSRPILLCLLVLCCCSGVLFVMGCWATLQFRWVQMQYPPVVLALERMVLAGGVTIAGPMISWGAVAAVGAAAAPYYVAFVMSGLYLLLAAPLPSSFHLKEKARGGGGALVGRSPADYAAQGRLETACCALITVTLPSAMYAAVHLHDLNHSQHFWGLLLLMSAPALVVLAAPGGLWWLPIPRKQMEVLRWIAAMVVLAIFVAGVEGRVVFSAFGEYILLHPPWNWLLVTAAIYGHGAVVLLHFSGALQSQAVYVATLTGLLGCCAAACVAVGLPLTILPAPLISAAGMGLFYRTRNLQEFLLFLVGAGITGLWFVGHHFWFLDITWAGHMTVQRACAVLILYTGPTLLLPGLLLSGCPAWLSGAALDVHALLLAAAEVLLLSGNYTVGDMYPAYAVLATSACGFVLSAHLGDTTRVPPWSVWTARLLYGAKVTMLFLPHPRQTLHAALLAGTAMAPVIMHPSRAGALRRVRLPAGLTLIYVSAIVFSTWESRHTLFGAVSELLSVRPGEGVALGSLLLLLALALYPLVSTHFPGSPGGRQAMVLLLTAGMLLISLKPPLPLHAVCHPHHKHHHHARWLCLQLFNAQDHVAREVDDVAIYGSGIGRREHWALWLLVVALLAGIAASGHQRTLRSSGFVGRVVLGLMSGVAVGGYVALELFPHQGPMQLLLLGVCLLVALAVVLVSLPAGNSPAVLPPILLLWAALLPAAILLERELPLPEAHLQRVSPDATVSVQDERRTFRFVSLLIVYAVQSALLAFRFKLKISQGSGGSLSSSTPTRGAALANGSGAGGNVVLAGLSGFLGNCLPAAAVSVGAYGRARAKASATGAGLRAEGLGWLPLASNLITLLCFVICVVLDRMWFDGGEVVVLPLCSLLLMLSQDSVLLPSLTQRRRYFPPVVAAVAHLTLVSFGEIMAMAHRHGDTMEHSPLVASSMQLLCLFFALPSHVLFLWYLWDWSLQSFTTLLFAAPLNLLAIAITQITSIRLLAGLGLAAAIVHWFTMGRSKRAGMRVI